MLLAAAALPFHELTLRVGPVGLRPFETCLILALIAALPSMARCPGEWWRPSRAPSRPGAPRRLDREVLAVVLLGAISLLVARGPGESARTFRLVILEPALFYLLLTRLFGGWRDVRLVVAGLVVGGVAASLVGLAQLATGIGPIEAEGVDRIRAFYRSPNNLALFLDRVAPPAVALALAGAGLVWAAAALVLLVALALTYSVGGWLATGVGLGATIALVRGRRTVAILALAALVALGGALAARPERVLGHFDLASDSTSGVRVLLWGSALQMLRDSPLFGVGLDNFVHLYNPERGGDYMRRTGGASRTSPTRTTCCSTGGSRSASSARSCWRGCWSWPGVSGRRPGARSGRTGSGGRWWPAWPAPWSRRSSTGRSTTRSSCRTWPRCGGRATP